MTFMDALAYTGVVIGFVALYAGVAAVAQGVMLWVFNDGKPRWLSSILWPITLPLVLVAAWFAVCMGLTLRFIDWVKKVLRAGYPH